MPRELEKCVRKVRVKGKVKNPHAVCRTSMGTNAAIRARRKKTRKRSS